MAAAGGRQGKVDAVGELSDEMRARIEVEMEKKAIDFFNTRDFGEAGAVFLAEKLRGNTTVEELSLQLCGIGAVGARALADSLGEHNVTLKILYLGGNEAMGDAGAQAMAEMVKKNTTLEELGLGRCGFGPRGARALGEALMENNSLKDLYLDGNELGDDGTEALAQALRWSESLEQLYLYGCKLTGVGAAALLSALRESNSTLAYLDLTDNNIENDEIKASIYVLLKENDAVRPETAERRARCLLFCCLKLAPSAHEHVVPSIGAVPVPVMQHAVEHAGQLHVAKRFECIGNCPSTRVVRSLHFALSAQVQQNAQLRQQNAQLQQQDAVSQRLIADLQHQDVASQRLIADLQQQIAHVNSRTTEIDSTAGTFLDSRESASSEDEDNGEPANKRAKTA